MSKYIIRLDDASYRRDIKKWDRMEKLLLTYHICPLVGLIPQNEDPALMFEEDKLYQKTLDRWKDLGWVFALHGFNHVYKISMGGGGLNPVNEHSEFVGVPLEEQRIKIKKGIKILSTYGIEPLVFFAPSHTFDKNTLIALKKESQIRIISDTISNKPYNEYGFTFVPQQSGSVRKLPFDLVTFCYHPNTMEENDFLKLESFLKIYQKDFIKFPLEYVERKKNIYDKFLSFAYFSLRKIRHLKKV
ncbi:Uncharacterized protein conserved in bacteria [Campylobacter hyointestinalis subsp. hyointestinalis]|uniref:Uncharacterized protein conserved in bacteria n=1 Tax=Campylobacter hyointestinalis subsp. hyointestinalis TaxID=91352 RepID=A0A0S4R3P6_CAMHY|nr:DUF2334 domain-containing protein [Campylobacter hyointestinalis]CUU68463.1 Uncharacterized protein conserved in bacteria [Campylobacter hyointestinalis subsp. hyointestinalis]CUU72885.1 Uncharacterized protein conserved in bacteria [Campylobacter hyointestinalis subsp. hyointestinalis]